jgi:hypothetical protein
VAERQATVGIIIITVLLVVILINQNRAEKQRLF